MKALSRGFTLIELMVVLVIVSIIGVGAYSLLDTFNSSDRTLGVRAEEMRRLSMALYRLDDDLRQLTPRPVKNGYSGYEPALLGEAGALEFTRLGAANLGLEPRGDLQRLRYTLGEAEGAEAELGGSLLLRGRWQVLDRAPDSESIDEPLLAGVESLEFRYYDPDTEAWLAQWPALSSNTALGRADARLPQAVEMRLTLRGGRELERVFNLPRVADARPAEAGNE